MTDCHPEERAQHASRRTAAKRALPDCSRRHFTLVVARFYPELADVLVDGAMRALKECGTRTDHIRLHEVPGCFELPLACKRAIGQAVDGVVALGVVIRGETPHFDIVAEQCARGIMDVQIATGVAIGFGVLTVNTMAQAVERCDPKGGDKGYHAALAAVMMAHGAERHGAFE